jgi:hypothetical protein
MAGVLGTLGAILLPKGKGTKGGIGAPPGFNPSRPLMTIPAYREHLTDLYTFRTASDSRVLLNNLVNQDPDISAAVHAYLTIAAASSMVVYAYDATGQVDTIGIQQVNLLLSALTTTNDYTTGFSGKPTLDGLLGNIRYMMLLRGAAANELILDKTYAPTELRNVDTATLRWQQPTPGLYVPEQRVQGVSNFIELNIPTFFHTTYHQNPTDWYSYSPFVSAINTIAARTEVINELHRIMKIVGYPRLDIKVLEEVLLTNAPPALRTDPNKVRDFVRSEMANISKTVAGLNADQAFVHSNAIEASIINEKNPGAGIQIQGVIDVLDSQNQAALKVMPAVIGKASNATTASTEARLFAMAADSLNSAVGSHLSKILTFALRLSGYQGVIQVTFPPIELRPVLELEPHLTMKAARLKQDLSLGIITDIEYSMQMYGRPPVTGAPPLSGTGFLNPVAAAAPATTDGVNTAPQGGGGGSNSLGRSLTTPGAKSAKSNATKSGTVGSG